LYTNIEKESTAIFNQKAKILKVFWSSLSNYRKNTKKKPHFLKIGVDFSA
jgi:hypothetical protein